MKQHYLYNEGGILLLNYTLHVLKHYKVKVVKKDLSYSCLFSFKICFLYVKEKSYFKRKTVMYEKCSLTRILEKFPCTDFRYILESSSHLFLMTKLFTGN